MASNRAFVCCDQKSAAEIGKVILLKGGNAADAAVAMAFAMGVLQPMDCGIGGDCNCIFYSASDNSVKAINGTGFSSKNLTLEKVMESGLTAEVMDKTIHHGMFVTVPGALAGMFKCVEQFGSQKLTMQELMAPAIQLANATSTVGPFSSRTWRKYANRLSRSENRKDVLFDEDFEDASEVTVSSPKLAACMEKIALNGCKEFYEGEIAKEITDAVRKHNGVLALEDMKQYYQDSDATSLETPLSVVFHGCRIWEMAPNTTGLVVLVAMKFLEGFDLKALGHNSVEYIHVIAEAINLAFYCCWEYLCDPNSMNRNYQDLLKTDYLNEKKKEINFDRHVDRQFKCSELLIGGNTNYLTAVDSSGNACSFIFSISSTFGSAIIPNNCGFVLHDRGKFFNLDKSSPHAFGPRKKCLHTIIPGLVTDDTTGELLATFGIVGRWIQPQAHIQVLLNMIVFGMEPQIAIQQPRFSVGYPFGNLDFREEYVLYLEDEFSSVVTASLASRGHPVKRVPSSENSLFGHGHIIAKTSLWSRDTPLSQSTWAAASDPRFSGTSLGL